MNPAVICLHDVNTVSIWSIAVVIPCLTSWHVLDLVSAHLGIDDCSAYCTDPWTQILVILEFRLFKVLGYTPPLLVGFAPDLDTMFGGGGLFGHIFLYGL